MGATSARSCPECDGRLNQDGIETVCAECGLVVAADRLDRGPEWRTFPGEEPSRKRTGAPLTRSRHDRGLSTEIGHHGDTVRLTGRKRSRIARLRRQHNRTQIKSKAERNQVYGFVEIRRVTSALELPDCVRDHACTLFERAQDEDLLRGRSLEGFAAAALYVACRVGGLSRTMDELTDVARASTTELKTAYKAMNRELGLPIGPADPREYLPRYADELEVSAEVERTARTFVERAHERELVSGRDPSGVAAACLYAAVKEHEQSLTQQTIADIADVTPVTLRTTYAALCKNHE